MMINWWCIVAIVSLVIGGVCSIRMKDGGYFVIAVLLSFTIGLGYFLSTL